MGVKSTADRQVDLAPVPRERGPDERRLRTRERAPLFVECSVMPGKAPAKPGAKPGKQPGKQPGKGGGSTGRGKKEKPAGKGKGKGKSQCSADSSADSSSSVVVEPPAEAEQPTTGDAFLDKLQAAEARDIQSHETIRAITSAGGG